MYRGRHQRNWICVGMGCYSYPDYEVLHEESCDTYGVFSIVKSDSWGNSFFLVVWRANRNTTKNTTTMCEGVDRWSSDDVRYDRLTDAIGSIPHWNKAFTPPKKDKRYRPRDSQKNKVYLWEHKMAKDLGPEELVTSNLVITDGNYTGVMRTTLERRRSHDDLQALLKDICNALGEQTPGLKFRSGGSCSYGGYKIQLLPCHCTNLVLIHELAHVLHQRWGRRTDNTKHQSHGQEYVGIYAYLLNRFAGIDMSDILRHAAEAKVKLHLPDQYHEWINIRQAA